MPWGAAYFLDDVKDLNMDSDSLRCESCKKWTCPGHLDTGYQIRIRLKNRPYLAWREVPHRVPFMGNHSVAFSPKSYEHDGRVFCTHLMRGSYALKEEVTDEVREARRRYCEYFYGILE